MVHCRYTGYKRAVILGRLTVLKCCCVRFLHFSKQLPQRFGQYRITSLIIPQWLKTKARKKRKKDQFGFTLEGEEIGYVDLDGAAFIAMKTARDAPGEYGGGYQDIPLVFEFSESRETEDHYVITLSFRPQGTFPRAPGSEQFYVTKEVVVDLRQVLDLPRPLGKSRRGCGRSGRRPLRDRCIANFLPGRRGRHNHPNPHIGVPGRAGQTCFTPARRNYRLGR